jgi:hypothetical protein
MRGERGLAGAAGATFDPTGLQARLSALEGIEMPSFTPFDPTGLQRRLSALEGARGPTMADIQALIQDALAQQPNFENPYAPSPSFDPFLGQPPQGLSGGAI